MGGAPALAFPRAHRERVSRRVVVDTGRVLEAEGSDRTRRLVTTRPARFASPAEAEQYIRATSPGYSDEIYAHRVRWLLRPTADGLVWRSDLAALERILAGSRSDLWSRIGEIAAPTLLVRGTRSAYLGSETARQMVERLPD